MSTAEATQPTDVLDRVKDWPPAQRITLRVASWRPWSAPQAPPLRAALSARAVQELIGLGAGGSPPPDDETVRRWIDERRMEKYGS